MKSIKIGKHKLRCIAHDIVKIQARLEDLKFSPTVTGCEIMVIKMQLIKLSTLVLSILKE